MSDAATAPHEIGVKPHHQPNYWVVFIALAVITAIITITELFIDSIPIPKEVIRTGFVVMSLIKATLVAMYYMHLKFDSFVYSVLFIVPVIFALFLVTVLAVGYIF